TAVQFLIPTGFEKMEWQKLTPIERYYLKMTEMEAKGEKTLDNYTNFARSFKIKHPDAIMYSGSKANSARLKLAHEFKNSMMSGDSEIANTPLRALLFAIYEISKDVDIELVLFHLMENCNAYLQHK